MTERAELNTRFLTLEDLLDIAQDIGVGPVRDIGLLDSSVARPQTTLMGAEAYPALELKTAALLHSIVCNHALIDGNKRLGWHACTVFAAINGFELAMSFEEAFDLVMAVASGELRDVPDIAARLRTAPR